MSVECENKQPDKKRVKQKKSKHSSDLELKDNQKSDRDQKEKPKKRKHDHGIVQVVDEQQSNLSKPTKKSKKESQSAKVESSDIDQNDKLKEKKSKKKKKKNQESSMKTNDEVASAPIKVQSSMSTSEISEYRSKHCISIDDQYQPGDFPPLSTFNDTGLNSDLLACTTGFTNPTPIQAQCWPILLSGRDCVGIAETGSGKTLAFALPALAHVQSRPALGRSVADRGPIVLVLSPTRELAMQSAQVCSDAGRASDYRTVCVYGGGDRQAQTKALERGCHMIVATPGRLLGYMREGVISLSRVSYLVLDEADRMLDLGFEPDIRAIVSALTQPKRQTVMFSATWPSEIQKLASEFLHDPVRVTIGTDQLTASQNVTQIVEVIDSYAKDARLDALLKKYHDKQQRLIVFVLYKKEAIRVEAQLRRRGWSCTSLHGDKSQTERTSALADFKSGRVPILIATDVAARGLDIPKVQYVINYSFPLTIEDYIHRIGRTGRAGNKGTAHTLFTVADKSHSGELINVLNEAGAQVPDGLMKFGAGVKKKQHALYGNHFKADDRPMPAKTHVKFS